MSGCAASLRGRQTDDIGAMCKARRKWVRTTTLMDRNRCEIPQGNFRCLRVVVKKQRTNSAGQPPAHQQPAAREGFRGFGNDARLEVPELVAELGDDSESVFKEGGDDEEPERRRRKGLKCKVCQEEGATGTGREKHQLESALRARQDSETAPLFSSIVACSGLLPSPCSLEDCSLRSSRQTLDPFGSSAMHVTAVFLPSPSRARVARKKLQKGAHLAMAGK